MLQLLKFFQVGLFMWTLWDYCLNLLSYTWLNAFLNAGLIKLTFSFCLIIFVCWCSDNAVPLHISTHSSLVLYRSVTTLLSLFISLFEDETDVFLPLIYFSYPHLPLLPSLTGSPHFNEISMNKVRDCSPLISLSMSDCVCLQWLFPKGCISFCTVWLT